MEKKKRNSQNSATFKIGAISLIFLIIGYQAAVFIHRSAILKIEALRDNPDTVYIVKHSPERMADTGDGSSGEGPRKSGNTSAVREGHRRAAMQAAGESFDTVRRYAGHSRTVRAVRAQTRKAESFRFNPNEAPVEDLVRLGFSEKQAASIDNYRKKGGRFRRKSDFAKSFVVSDSIFRRLEPYIDIPLTDINSADSAAFDALPGIGPYFAAKMVEYRRKLGGYSHTEQLMDIYNFDREKYDSLKDLICCSPPQPYPLWILPEDSLRLHPYVGGRAEARAIVRFRDNSPADSLTVEALSRAGVLPEERAAKLARCRIAAVAGLEAVSMHFPYSLHFMYFCGYWTSYNSKDVIRAKFNAFFSKYENQYGIQCSETVESVRFDNLIEAVSNKTGRQVAILIDEYDKPFLASGKQIIKLGINFSSETRCVDGWKMA